MRKTSLLWIVLALAWFSLACDDEESKDPSTESDLEETQEEVVDNEDSTETTGEDLQDTSGEDTTDGTDDSQDLSAEDIPDTREEDLQDVQVNDLVDTADAPEDVVEPGCEVPAPFDIGVSYSSTLHVSTQGSADGDGSAQAPYDTIRTAANHATPGTEILVHTGTYSGSTFLDIQGEANAPIAIRGAGDGEVILDAGGAAEVMHLVEARYIVLEDLTLQNSSHNGLNIDDGGSYETPAEFVVLRRLVVRDIGAGGNHDCIKLSGLDRFHVIESEISHCNAGDAIDMVGCHEGVIHGNLLRDTPGGGIQAKGGSADVLIHGNHFVDVVGRGINAGGSTGLEFFRPMDAPHEAARIEVRSNIFVRPGEESGASIAYVGCDGCEFINNTIYLPTTWIARILQERTEERFVPCREGVFANNIIVFNVGDLRSGVFVNVGANTAPETFVFANNLWHALDQPGFTGPNLTGGIPAETSTLVGDPGFLGPNSDDFTPSSSGPAAGAADSAFMDLNLGDLEGTCYADPPSLGAVEPL